MIKAKYGTWKCSKCNSIYETRAKLKAHIQQEHNEKIPAIKIDGKYVCPYCNKVFDSSKGFGGHVTNCAKHPNKIQHDLSHKKSSKTAFKKFVNGKLVPLWIGKHHTQETRQRMRKAACKYLMENNPTPCRYNKSSIKVLEQIAKEHGWNIQHAENGGEFYTGIGYWLDAYDKEKNVVLEYDEPEHYEDVENNILREKDLKRQNEIIEHLHCEYWRYNEKMKVLWKVC